MRLGAVNLNQTAVGEGVRVDSTAQQFTQGDITTTSSNLDLAISGDGFFTLQDASGTVYSRNGEFSPDKNGNVVNATGQALQVYPPTANGGFNTGTTTDLNLETAQSAPNATTTGTIILNLPAGLTRTNRGALQSYESGDLHPVYVDHGVRLARQCVSGNFFTSLRRRRRISGRSI